MNVRTSRAIEFPLAVVGAPFPVVLETVSPHTSAEISNIELVAEGDLTPDILARVVLHFLDLYNRNPTSTPTASSCARPVLRFGTKWEALKEMPGTTVYLGLGKAPRFSKQIHAAARKLRPVGHGREPLRGDGGRSGRLVRAACLLARERDGRHARSIFRDPNALAGDNGTPERTVGSTVPVVYGSGIPILYDTMETDVNFSGRFQLGGGVGLRFNWGESRRDGVDLLGWYFRRDLAPYVALRGTFYSGDLEVLEGFNNPLPFHGTEKYEYGVNLEARFGPVHLFGQGVKQSIAGLEREGYEVEASVRIALPGLFASGDQSVVNWIEPAVRVSYIDNLFDLPAGFVAPSFGWDWRNHDFRLPPRHRARPRSDRGVLASRVDDAQRRHPPGRRAPDAPRGFLILLRAPRARGCTAGA